MQVIRQDDVVPDQPAIRLSPPIHKQIVDAGVAQDRLTIFGANRQKDDDGAVVLFDRGKVVRISSAWFGRGGHLGMIKQPV